jgi:hypothetical protein
MSLAPESFTAHEVKLLQKAVKHVDKAGGEVPSGNRLAKILHCDSHSARRIAKVLNGSEFTTEPTTEEFPAPPVDEAVFDGHEHKVIEDPSTARMVETNEITGNRWVISLPKTRIRTLEELVEACNIDLKVWIVDRFVANKWEVGSKDASKEIVVTALFQVKAFLSRRPLKADGTVIEDEGSYIAEIAKLRSKLAKNEKEVRAEKSYSRHLALNHLGADDFLDKMKGFMDKMGEFSLPTVQPHLVEPLIAPLVREGHTEDAVALWSDMHFGDRTRREDMSGFPKFDMPVSGNRWGYVIRKMKQCLTLHRAMYPIDTLHIWIGGDVGNGILHDSPNSNELFTPAQVHFSYQMMKFAIEDVLTLTVPDAQGRRVVNRIELLFTVGNHMRLDEKMPYKFQAQRTLDWLIYQFVIEKFKDNPNIGIKQEMAPYIFENIRGHRHLFAHGMQVGYRNSPDAQCKSMASFIDRVRALFDSPEWRNANRLQGETFARICIGDIHVPVSFPRLISNGSLNGQNELGVNWVMEPIPAGQQLFGVSDKHLETWKYFIDCTHVQDEPGDYNSYGDYAREYAEKLGR